MALRRRPEDFVVDELPDPDWLATLAPTPAGPAPHAIYTLTKASLTTPDACRALAAQLGIPASALDYAGLKDRHAQTTQRLSAPRAAFSAEPPAEVSAARWSARLDGYAPAAVTAAIIRANRFTITARGLAKSVSQAMHERNQLLARRAEPVAPGTPRGLLIVNYFGRQRFGSARHGQGFAARELLRGDFESALRLLIATPARKDTGELRTFTRRAADHWGDWQRLARDLPNLPLRRPIEALAAGEPAAQAFTLLPAMLQQLCVEAFQSRLWNAVAAKVAATFTAAGTPIEVADPFGTLVFPRSASVPDEALALDIPMPAADLLHRPEASAQPWWPALQQVLADERLALRDLRVPTLRRPAFRSVPRRLFVFARPFSMTRPEPDELGSPGQTRRTLTFELPRGSYATVVLRALGH